MTGETYAATPYLRRLTPANGWHAQLFHDRYGHPVAIVAVLAELFELPEGRA